MSLPTRVAVGEEQSPRVSSGRKWGARHRKKQVPARPGTRLLMRSPVTGWQDVGKPAGLIATRRPRQRLVSTCSTRDQPRPPRPPGARPAPSVLGPSPHPGRGPRPRGHADRAEPSQRCGAQPAAWGHCGPAQACSAHGSPRPGAGPRAPRRTPRGQARGDRLLEGESPRGASWSSLPAPGGTAELGGVQPGQPRPERPLG